MAKLENSFTETVPIGGGNTENQSAFGGGTVQSFAEMMPGANRNPSQMAVFTDQPMGTLQNDFSGTVPLKKAPHRGYESGTPMNDSEDYPGA